MFYSQLGQDLWVLEETNYKKNGFFVDIGCNEPININNTYLLEQKYNWTGICIEPLKKLFEKSKKLRSKRTIIDNSLLFSESGKIVDFKIAGAISGIVETLDSCHDRKNFTNHQKLETITLNNLLHKYNAPKNIDYISVDTEGSEFEILKNFNFNNYNVKLFSIEHNFDKEKREKIYNLLKQNNYTRIDQDKQYPYIIKVNEKWRKKDYKKDKIFEDWYKKND